jgi:hypothetical protein
LPGPDKPTNSLGFLMRIENGFGNEW